MDWAQNVIVDPKIMGGKAVIKGTRVPVLVILGGLSGGDSIDEVCEGYGITHEDVRAALAYAAETLEHAAVYQIPSR